MLQILHSTNNNKNASKALIAAEYTGVKVEVPKDFQMGVSNNTPEFLKMNPIGKVCYSSLCTFFNVLDKILLISTVSFCPIGSCA